MKSTMIIDNKSTVKLDPRTLAACKCDGPREEPREEGALTDLP